MKQLTSLHTKIILALLVIAGFILRWYYASQYPFLHDWDERFHALVSKNMMETPFVPRLIPDPILPYDYKQWTLNHIWLQKQPFFMWQMALSMKIFGVGVMQLRLPSILMGSLLILPTYRIGRIVSGEKVLGIIAGAIAAVSGYQISLASGVQGMDHNDMAFLFYISMSIYCFIEYTQRPKSKLWVLVGIFSGIAILNKWLVGLLVFSGWGLYLLLNKEWRKDKSQYLKLIASALICFVVFIPWQIYIHSAFPVEAAYIQEFFTKHLFEVVEGHGQPWDYYFTSFKYLYGEYSMYPFFIGLAFMLFNKEKRLLNSILLIYVAIIYTFFTIVPSKLLSFPFVVAPLIYIIMAYGVYGMATLIKSNVLKYSVLALLLSLTMYMNYNRLIMDFRRGEQGPSYPVKAYNTAEFKKMKTTVPKDYVIFIAGGQEYAEATFFSDHLVYNWWIKEEQFKELKEKGYKMAVVKNQSNLVPPWFFLYDEDVLKLDVSLKYKVGYTPK